MTTDLAQVVLPALNEPVRLLRELVEADNAVKQQFAEWDAELKANGSVMSTVGQASGPVARRDAAWQSIRNYLANPSVTELACKSCGRHQFIHMCEWCGVCHFENR